MDRSYYTVGDVGATRSMTPEGFLLCEGVAIARTGVQLYSTDEVPFEANQAGELRIHRNPEDVFRPETIASFEGKPVTIDHPDTFVTPANWNSLAVGVTQNVRRGEGVNDDLLIADLLITSADAIKYVNANKPHLSAGYESDYEQGEPGLGTQRNIVGNHVALVERGRAGPRVAIKDQEPKPMKKSWLDRIKAAVATEDESVVRAVVRDSAEETKTDDAWKDSVTEFMKSTSDRFKAQDEAEAKSKEDEEEEEKKKKEKKETDDAGEVAVIGGAEKVTLGTLYTGDAWAEVRSRAEILSPGISMPTADSVKAPDALRAFMTKAIESAIPTHDSVKALVAGRDLKKMTGDSLLTLFHSGAELVRAVNNGKTATGKVSTKDFSRPFSIADMQKANTEFWSKRA